MFSDYVISKGSTKSEHGSEDPELFTPEPTDRDYEKGYITRYFAQKKSGPKKITEISESQFETHKLSYRGLNNKLYEVFSIEWEITGPKNDIYKGKVPVSTGVESTNINLLELEEEDHPGIMKYLNDPLEFWEGRN